MPAAAGELMHQAHKKGPHVAGHRVTPAEKLQDIDAQGGDLCGRGGAAYVPGTDVSGWIQERNVRGGNFCNGHAGHANQCGQPGCLNVQIIGTLCVACCVPGETAIPDTVQVDVSGAVG